MVDVIKNRLEHLVIGGGRRPAFGVEAGVNDAIHVEVEVVKLDAVGVGAAEVDGDEGAGLDSLSGIEP